MVKTQQEGASLLKMFFICVSLQEINICFLSKYFLSFENIPVKKKKVGFFSNNKLIKKEVACHNCDPLN